MTITWGFGPAMEDSFSSLCQQIRVTFEAHAKDASNHNLQTQSLGKLQGFLNFHRNNLLSPLSYPVCSYTFVLYIYIYIELYIILSSFFFDNT